jgi:hypothetical protein
MTRRVVTVQVAEGGGVPIPQYVELSNALAGMPPGEYRVTIEPADAKGGEDHAYNDGYLAAIYDGRRRP